MFDKIKSFRLESVLLVITVVSLLVAQWLMTKNSLGQIRYEELSESVRNVYWLQQRQLFDGISSNVGWYGTLLIIYQIIGFQLNLAKYVRLILQGLALISLALIFKRHLKLKQSWLPLLVIGLSPTWLFFNTMQASYGLDLQYLPVVVWLLFAFEKSQRSKWQFVFAFIFGFLVMLASMSYGTFLAYWPFLGVGFFWLCWQKQRSIWQKLGLILTALVGFLIPLASALWWLTEPSQLIFDPEVKSGLFRGGGMGDPITSLAVLGKHLREGIKLTLFDAFVKGSSYYYEPVRSEFSHAALPFVIIIGLGVSLVELLISHKKKVMTTLIVGWLLLVVGLVFGSISNWFPGIRRSTPALVGLMIILVGLWQDMPRLIMSKNIFLKARGGIILGIFIVLLMHRLRIFPQNLLGMKLASSHKAGVCFHRPGKTPRESVEETVKELVAQPQQSVKVVEAEEKKCRLHEFYPALAGYCLWNEFECGQIEFSPAQVFKKPN